MVTETNQKKLADKISNMDAIQYVTKKRVYRMDAVVTFAKSQGFLRFNEKMVKLLQMNDWNSVLVGLDRRSGIIVIKKVDPEEPGAIAFRSPKEKDTSRIINVNHLINQFDLSLTKTFRAERNGNIVLLEGIISKEQ